ncbi:Uncharacterized protein YnzC, UPF0291/DUF896 family [Pasteurella testudinis DSM 23072]|uniref:Uncharacterized protein YnzC, UPF0291/DUF896 family n=1 Tax=Pasteurella testudinis DSM 23072 TaxID=1122938 RepID=A0A1W1UF83_9PAST|nr:DUF896 domain-containing protein [Pasteurella testudinis]SMB79444.1 Uncharacterized protein YnzC, UPF0291/DUF896 family [Pasteurella testudinis DSM 23072]SUB50768.1 Uncharacterized protein conserved in bacteria [Pasteurella testudinis]
MRIPELNRINELARKAKHTALSAAELNERAELRQRYLAAIRGQMNTILATVSVVDPLGNDVTPAKLRHAQRHGMII